MIVLQFAKVIRNELEQWRDSLLYVELVTFVGCCIAALLQARLISMREDKVLRQVILDE